MSKKLFTILSALLLVTLLLGACGPKPTEAPQQPVATEEPTAPEVPAAPEETAAPEEPMEEGFTIGISNPFISSEYRTQMIAELIEVNQEY
ncbi:MAG TPA: hypothetical protein VIS10_01445, partial [Anaerolineales bacterium]